MGTCCYCGTKFPKTRATRKYCTPRCKTNACLDRKPRRIRSADVQALYDLLDLEFASAEGLRERLREILDPEAAPIPLDGDRVFIPRLD
jgi:NAD-dependent oxidoreductase involved in siderophore biosynthesis